MLPLVEHAAIGIYLLDYLVDCSTDSVVLSVHETLAMDYTGRKFKLHVCKRAYSNTTRICRNTFSLTLSFYVDMGALDAHVQPQMC